MGGGKLDRLRRSSLHDFAPYILRVLIGRFALADLPACLRARQRLLHLRLAQGSRPELKVQRSVGVEVVCAHLRLLSFSRSSVPAASHSKTFDDGVLIAEVWFGVKSRLCVEEFELLSDVQVIAKRGNVIFDAEVFCLRPPFCL